VGGGGEEEERDIRICGKRGRRGGGEGHTNLWTLCRRCRLAYLPWWV